MTPLKECEEMSEDEQQMKPEELFAYAMNLLNQSGVKYLTIALDSDGSLACHTSAGLERHEIVGLLEVVRDETRN